jgi:hypothetical protein
MCTFVGRFGVGVRRSRVQRVEGHFGRKGCEERQTWHFQTCNATYSLSTEQSISEADLDVMINYLSWFVVVI